MSGVSNGAVLSGDLARRVIDPHAYAQWDGLLDTFDQIRATTPVVKVQPDTPGLFDPFWLVTGYDDVMRMSKDNATFLNNPRPVVFSFAQAIEFSRAATGSNMLVDSLVVFDAPIHPKYRKLTQEWFMPRNLGRLEDELRALAARTVDRMLESSTERGGEVDFVKEVSGPYPLRVVMQILGVPAGRRAADADAHPAIVRRAGQGFVGQRARSDDAGTGGADRRRRGEDL